MLCSNTADCTVPTLGLPGIYTYFWIWVIFRCALIKLYVLIYEKQKAPSLKEKWKRLHKVKRINNLLNKSRTLRKIVKGWLSYSRDVSGYNIRNVMFVSLLFYFYRSDGTFGDWSSPSFGRCEEHPSIRGKEGVDRFDPTKFWKAPAPLLSSRWQSVKNESSEWWSNITEYWWSFWRSSQPGLKETNNNNVVIGWHCIAYVFLMFTDFQTGLWIPKLIFPYGQKSERFRWFLTLKIHFES